jgi:hypothetical protein
MLPKEIEPGEPGDWVRHAWSDLELAHTRREFKDPARRSLFSCATGDRKGT